jgi:L-alanine-DL-glutamate epimerase-like enolase superfamily enzyme
MIHLESVRITLPLKRTFAVSQGAADIKTVFLTILNNRYNGEASGSVYLGPSDDEIECEIKKGLELLAGLKEITVDTLQDIARFDINPAARAALTGMILNYISGESKRYPWEVLALGTPVGVKSSVTVSVGPPRDMVEAIKTCDYPIIKIKMGHEQDIMILDALEQVQGKEIRVDANGGWSCAKAEEMIFHLSRKGVRIIEQPTTSEFVEEWPHLKGKDEDVELIIDEGLNDSNDYDRFANRIDGINIKMEKCGGILEGVRLAEKARGDKKKVMLGCMVESSVGIAQSVYMSSQADYFDLDGPLLLENDIADGIRYDRESIKVDREIIGGPKLKRDVIEKYIT